MPGHKRGKASSSRLFDIDSYAVPFYCGHLDRRPSQPGHTPVPGPFVVKLAASTFSRRLRNPARRARYVVSKQYDGWREYRFPRRDHVNPVRVTVESCQPSFIIRAPSGGVVLRWCYGKLSHIISKHGRRQTPRFQIKMAILSTISQGSIVAWQSTFPSR